MLLPDAFGPDDLARVTQAKPVTQFTFDAPTVIRTKRDGGRLPDDQIDWVIDAYTHGGVGDEQMAALLMAIFLRGMDARRDRPLDRGDDQLRRAAGLRRSAPPDAPGRPLALVDKHSTGGVGDKITIPLVPVVAACGAAVPQASGRGLGHTGGTLDKLESIPGFTAEIGIEAIRRQLVDVGAAIFAAGDLAPADRKIYALRDITSTVDSLPLIASSIMSKKLAEGADALVLDVKFGSGAFMKAQTDARALARTMVDLGQAHGVPTRAVLTDMGAPLGRAIGNAVEVAGVAGGARRRRAGRRRRAHPGAGPRHARAGRRGRRRPGRHAADGTAMDRFRALVAAQGGDATQPLPIGGHTETVPVPRSGTMGDIDALAVGLAVWRLGAGRAVPGERVQSGAGLRIHRKPGEPVVAGEPLFTLYTDTPQRLARRAGRTRGRVRGRGFAAGRPSADRRSARITDAHLPLPLTPGLHPAGTQGAAARPSRRRPAPCDRARYRRQDRL